MMGILSQSYFFKKKESNGRRYSSASRTLAYHVQSSEYNPHPCMKSDMLLNAYNRSTQRKRQEEAEGILHLTWNTKFQQNFFSPLQCSIYKLLEINLSPT